MTDERKIEDVCDRLDKLPPKLYVGDLVRIVYPLYYSASASTNQVGWHPSSGDVGKVINVNKEQSYSYCSLHSKQQEVIGSAWVRFSNGNDYCIFRCSLELER